MPSCVIFFACVSVCNNKFIHIHTYFELTHLLIDLILRGSKVQPMVFRKFFRFVRVVEGNAVVFIVVLKINYLFTFLNEIDN